MASVELDQLQLQLQQKAKRKLDQKPKTAAKCELLVPRFFWPRSTSATERETKTRSCSMAQTNLLWHIAMCQDRLWPPSSFLPIPSRPILSHPIQSRPALPRLVEFMFKHFLALPATYCS